MININKEYLNKLLIEEINRLIEKKERLCEEISEIATYLGGFNDFNVNLTRLDVREINEKRNEMNAIYDLIIELDKLRNKECD